MRRLGFARVLSCSLLAASILACAAPTLAQFTPIQGFGPDLQVAGGIGFGLDHAIDNNFLGRLRLGALYASEPYWIAGGLDLEAGALAGLAIGGQIEVNEFRGWFANLGLTVAKDDRITGHVSVGYMIFGLEFEHAFGNFSPSEALLLSVRFPLGFWWFTSGHEERPFAPPPSSPAQPPSAAHPPAAVSGANTPPPRPLGPTTGAGSSQTGGPTGAQTQTPVVDPQTRERIERGQHALEEATVAALRGDRAAESDALRRAYLAQPDPLLYLRIADAELAQGNRARSAEALQHFIASTATSDSPNVLAEKPNAQAKLNELVAQLARLRVTLEVKGNEEVAIDGALQPSLLLGYDVLIDPGSHVLTLRAAGQLLLEQPFEAHAGELVRLAPELPLPAAAPDPAR